MYQDFPRSLSAAMWGWIIKPPTRSIYFKSIISLLVMTCLLISRREYLGTCNTALRVIAVKDSSSWPLSFLVGDARFKAQRLVIVLVAKKECVFLAFKNRVTEFGTCCFCGDKGYPVSFVSNSMVSSWELCLWSWWLTWFSHSLDVSCKPGRRNTTIFSLTDSETPAFCWAVAWICRIYSRLHSMVELLSENIVLILFSPGSDGDMVFASMLSNSCWAFSFCASASNAGWKTA